jgi:hypothetical protein
MTIEQTVEIPADHRLFLEIAIPQEIPAGKTTVWHTFPLREREAPVNLSKEEIKNRLLDSVINKGIDPEIRAAANRKLCGCQTGGDGHDVERFLERRQAERNHEQKIEEQQREESNKWQKS